MCQAHCQMPAAAGIVTQSLLTWCSDQYQSIVLSIPAAATATAATNTTNVYSLYWYIQQQHMSLHVDKKLISSQLSVPVTKVQIAIFAEHDAG